LHDQETQEFEFALNIISLDALSLVVCHIFMEVLIGYGEHSETALGVDLKDLVKV
jgi:hypothetical protein